VRKKPKRSAAHLISNVFTRYLIYKIYLNPYPANVGNMVSS